MSSANNKIQADRNQRALLELVNQPGNDVCADCRARAPRWASHNLGIFICVNCASIHRKIGTHITKVKSITLDTWAKEQVEHMKQNGNVKSNAFYNPDETRHPPPTNLIDSERDSELEKYIRAKYEFKSFRKSATRQDSTPRINPPSSSSVSKLSLLHIASSADRSAAVAALLGPSRSAANRISPSPSPSVQSNKAKPESSTVPPPVPQKTPAQLNQPPSASALPSLVTEATPVPYSSQPVPTQSQPQAPGQLGGVWNDLQSLQPKTIDATLPLQIASFQQPSAQPLVTPYSTIQPLLSTQNAFGNLSNSPGASFPSALSHNTAVSAGTVGRSVSLGSGLNATQPSSSYQGGLSPFQASPLASSTSLTPVSGTPSPNPFAPQALPYVGATPTGYGGISGLSHSPESSFPASPSPYAGQQPIPPQQQSSHLFQQPSQVQTPMFQPQHQPQPQFLHPQLQVPNGMNAYMQIQSPGTPFMTAQPYGSTPSPFPQTQSYSQVPPQMQQQQQGQGFAGASQFTSWVQQPPSQQQWGM